MLPGDWARLLLKDERNVLQVAIAEVIVKAQNDVIEEAARIADEKMQYMASVEGSCACYDIAVSIRALHRGRR